MVNKNFENINIMLFLIMFYCENFIGYDFISNISIVSNLGQDGHQRADFEQDRGLAIAAAPGRAPNILLLDNNIPVATSTARNIKSIVAGNKRKSSKI